MAKPTMLYISPVVPMFRGAGIAMRAALHIRELSGLFAITLAIVLDGQAEDEAEEEISPDLRALCAEMIISSEGPWQARVARAAPSSWKAMLATVLRVPPARQRKAAAAKLAQSLGSRAFDVVHCFRLITAPALILLKKNGVVFGRAVLDMDDYESRTKKRYAQTLLRRQGWLQSFVGEMEARAWYRFESRVMEAFDDLCVCSELDRRLLSERIVHPRVAVIPNVIEEVSMSPVADSKPFTFLFVGTLGYPPNHDAVMFFCKEVYPLLRRKADMPFRFEVVGARPDRTLMALGNGSDIEIVGAVPDVGPYYLKASAVVVPLRTGGGTRIKILEAQSHGRVVVSTTIGAEGLDISPGEDILIADSAEEFAKKCWSLMEDGALRDRIGRAGRSLFERSYTVSHLSARLKALYAKQFSMKRSLSLIS